MANNKAGEPMQKLKIGATPNAPDYIAVVKDNGTEEWMGKELVYLGQDKELANRIVTAVNGYDEMIEALKIAQHVIKKQGITDFRLNRIERVLEKHNKNNHEK